MSVCVCVLLIVVAARSSPSFFPRVVESPRVFFFGALVSCFEFRPVMMRMMRLGQQESSAVENVMRFPAGFLICLRRRADGLVVQDDAFRTVDGSFKLILDILVA